MFDSRLSKGVVFKIDADAAKELGLDEGQEFAITRDATEVETRASKFEDGKPRRGRPRRFDTRLVARLLGITDLTFPEPTVVDESTSDEADDEAVVADLLAGAESEGSDQEPW